jgi:hypothetical protein
MAYEFERKVLNVSKLKQAKLLRPAEIANEKPDSGVTITNKSAYFVIRDCASITRKYLVLLCYGELKNPIELLQGKFTRAEINDFCKRAYEYVETSQLLSLILLDIKKRSLLLQSQVSKPVQAAVTNFSEPESDEIYSDYEGSIEEQVAILEVKEEVDVITNGSYEAVCQTLIEAFKPTQ